MSAGPLGLVPADPLGLLRRGLHRPGKIPRYLFGLLVPSSRWGPEWRRRDGVVTFEPGGYAASPRTRPEFAANLAHEVSGLWALLDDLEAHDLDRSLEVGCGYGRLSPWLATRSDWHVALDPDGRALANATEQYREWELEFVRGRAETLPCPDDAFDLVVTWTVLQHVPDGTIGAATSELRRVLSPDGHLVCCERVEPPADDHIWPRSIEEYDRLLAPLSLVEVRDRPVEPTWSDAMPTDEPSERLLAFRGPDG
ncbi:class I SAM-dependent methyltransferase [Halopiger goleimassiliensis]|uniref:class I SAM-dependent methyltransferase n=1 Tax=Halopiger goleimassiliensis TaxID=1293048 RepID=UPI0006778DD6|nr:class I SAM-dependent methyltransferase [Halopiger goleimassiliensis]